MCAILFFYRYGQYGLMRSMANIVVFRPRYDVQSHARKWGRNLVKKTGDYKKSLFII
jgi:hypothetical protein